MWMLLFLLLPALYVWLILPRLPRRDLRELAGVDYAHRGLWNLRRPENSLSAFRVAVEAGFGIELDVHLTADGQLVVYHDFTLQRMCGQSGRIEQLDLATLRTCRLNGTGEPIPTLDEVLVLVKGQVPLILELKVAGNAAALSRAVYQRMQRYHGSWCMESFSPLAPLWFRVHAPEVIRGQLVYNHSGQPDRKPWRRLLDAFVASMVGNVLSRPDFIACEGDARCLNSLPMRLLSPLRPNLMCWTIRSPEEMDRLRPLCDTQIFEGFLPRKR